MVSSWRDFVTNYRTTKYVVIKSSSLKIPYLLGLLAVGAYIFFWTLGKNLGILRRSPVNFRPVGLLEKPIKNWWNCTDSDIDCWRDIPEKAPDYCGRNDYVGDMSFGFNFQKRYVNRCYHDDAQGTYSDSFIIPTMVTQIEQDWSHQHEDWVNTYVNDYYWYDVESHFLSLLHAFQIPGRHALDASVFDSQGFIMGPNVTAGADKRLQLRNTDTYRIKSGSNLAMEMVRLQSYPFCDQVLSGNCSSTRWGDYISVRTLLEVAGVSLDAPRTGINKTVFGNPARETELMTYRMAGLALAINVEYSNYEVVYKHLFQDFNIKRFLNPPSRYTYKVSISDTFEEHVMLERKVSHPFGNENKRRVTRIVGISVTLRGNGKVGHFSVSHISVQLAISISLMAVAKYVVEHVLTRIYQCTNPNAAYMWENYAEEHTLDDADFEQELKRRFGEDFPKTYMNVERHADDFIHLRAVADEECSMSSMSSTSGKGAAPAGL